MSIIHGAQAGQGGPVTIACINKATVDLGVPLDKLTATLQKCFDEYFLSVWGYPVKLYTADAPRPTDCNSFTSMTLIRPERSATMT